MVLLSGFFKVPLRDCQLAGRFAVSSDAEVVAFPMKKSMNIWSLPAEWDFARKLAAVRKAGFAGFEPDLSESGPINLDSTVEELAAVRHLAAEHGLTLSGLATGLYWGSNPASADAAIRERAARTLRRQIECAAALGIDSILVVPGAVGVDFIPGAEVVPYEIAWERATAFIGAALLLAA